MGTTSSVQSGEPEERRSTQKKSLRNEFEKEFGIKHEEGEEQNERTNTIASTSQQSGRDAMVNPAVFKAKRLFIRSLSNKRPKQINFVVKKQNNGALLKEMYRRMDPTITTLSNQLIVGEVELAVKYKLFEQKLLVRISRAKNLEKDGIGLPDPYVTAELYQESDPSNMITQKTTVKSNTCDPLFQEILVFHLLEKEIATGMIRLTVWDKDVITQDDFLGEAIIRLCKLDLSVGSTLWHKLHPRTDVSISGSIDVTITFNEPNNVIITLHQAYDLKAHDKTTNTSNPYVRLYVTGIPSKVETKINDCKLNPEWNESFEFTVHPDEFSRRIVVLNIINKERGSGRDKRLGDVHIPLIEFDKKYYGEKRNYMLQDLRNTPHTRSKWSEEGLSMEFKEAMKAHAIYGYPKFFFKKVHHGKKVVSCRSTKARSEARMVITNGIPSYDT